MPDISEVIFPRHLQDTYKLLHVTTTDNNINKKPSCC